MIESRFFNELLYTAVASGSTRDKAIRDPEPSTATYFEAVTLNGPFTLRLVQKSKHVPSLATYEYAAGQFFYRKHTRMYTCREISNELNVSAVIFSLGIYYSVLDRERYIEAKAQMFTGTSRLLNYSAHAALFKCQSAWVAKALIVSLRSFGKRDGVMN